MCRTVGEGRDAVLRWSEWGMRVCLGFAWGSWLIYLDACANIFFCLVLLDLGLPSSGWIGDGRGVLPV